MVSVGPNLNWYHRGDIIGSGSFGNVSKYHLKEEHHNEDCPRLMAVKCILGGMNQFRELGMCQITHRNIVIFFGVEAIDRIIHIKMELARINLKKFQSDVIGGPFEGYDFLHLALQIAEGVEYLHEQGYAHRDIKPHNILVFWPGDNTNPPVSHVILKLCDFGLTRGVPDDNAAEMTMTAVGTFAYMAPEVKVALVNSAKFHGDYKKNDVFSCGIVFYELLVNTRPEITEQTGFPGNTLIANKELCQTKREEFVALLSLMLSSTGCSRISAKCAANMIRPLYNEALNKQKVALDELEKERKELQDKIQREEIETLEADLDEQIRELERQLQEFENN